MNIRRERGYLSIIAPRLTRLIGCSPDAAAVALVPGVMLFRREEDKIPWIINHERIHFRQQIELLVIFSILLDVIENIWAMCVLRKSWGEAYLWSSAEQEAYRNEHDYEYLARRKPFAQLWYLFHKREFVFGDPGEIIYIDESHRAAP